MRAWAPLRQRLFFTHVPKTGGMSVRRMLASQYPHNSQLPVESWADLKPEHLPLTRYQLYSGHFRYDFRRFLPEDTQTVIVLREPVARTISHISHLSQDPHFHPLHEYAKGRELKDLINDQVIKDQCTNIITGHLAKPKQRYTLEDCTNGIDIDKDCFDYPEDTKDALLALHEIEHVCFLETIDADIANFFENIGLHPSRTIPKVNTHRERGADAPFDAEFLEMVRCANALDCEVYEAAKSLRSRRVRETRLQRLLNEGVYSVIDSDTEFPLSGPIPGSGLWEQEEVDGRFYRWSGPEDRLTFELPLASHRNYRIELALYNEGPIDIDKVSVNGIDVKFNLDPGDDDWHKTFAADFALDDAPVFTSVQLVGQKPRKGQNRDPRWLGFIITEFRVRVAQH